MPYCQKCGAQVSENAKFCKVCGFQIQSVPPLTETQASSPLGTTSPPIERNQVSVGSKSLSTALLLAILPGLIGIWGIGHFYLGRATRGIVILLAGLFIGVIAVFVSFITFGIGLPIGTLVLAGWALESWDAYRIAKQMGCR